MTTINHRTARSKSPSTTYPVITVYISESRGDTVGGGNDAHTCLTGLIAEGFCLLASEVVAFAAGTPTESHTYRFMCRAPVKSRHLWVQRLQRLAQRLCCGVMEVDEENKAVGQIGDMLAIA